MYGRLKRNTKPILQSDDPLRKDLHRLELTLAMKRERGVDAQEQVSGLCGINSKMSWCKRGVKLYHRLRLPKFLSGIRTSTQAGLQGCQDARSGQSRWNWTYCANTIRLLKLRPTEPDTEPIYFNHPIPSFRPLNKTPITLSRPDAIREVMNK